jgi:hypothetical protein
VSEKEERRGEVLGWVKCLDEEEKDALALKHSRTHSLSPPPFHSDAGSPDTVTEDTFSVDVSHGQQPESVDFGYAIFPAVATVAGADAAAQAFHKGVTVLQNDAHAQAIVYGADTLMVTVWQANASVSAGSALDNLSLSQVSAPCVLLIRVTASDFAFNLADPNQLASSLSFVVTRGSSGHTPSPVNTKQGPSYSCTAQAADSTLVTVSLPSGQFAGSTVSGSCSL